MSREEVEARLAELIGNTVEGELASVALDNPDKQDQQESQDVPEDIEH
jgi:hypothetical protein